MNLRKRLLDLEQSKLEIRSEQDAVPQITGYGIVYGQETRIWDDLHEIIHPGAASQVLAANPDIRSAFNHSCDKILGRTKSGTLKLEEDNHGVRYVVVPPDAQWARDLMVSIERGDIDGSSFTFGVDPQDEKITKRKDGTYLREIFAFSIIGEMGPVSYPAYEGTSTNVRSLQEEYDSFAEYLRAQDNSDEIADRQRALAMRKRRLELLEKSI